MLTENTTKMACSTEPRDYGAIPQSKDIEQEEWAKAEYHEEIVEANEEDLIRLGFIRKVYGILSFQLIITLLCCIIASSFPSIAAFQIEHKWIFIICFIISIITIIALFCSRNLSRTVPTNYILLTIFTLCEAYSISILCSMYESKIVILASFMTAGMVVALTLYAIYTRKDFTLLGGLLFISLCSIILFGFVCIFTTNRIIHILYSTIGAFLFSIYIIYDTQLIIGDREQKIEMDDYILGAITLYLDIINLFFYLLKLLRELNKNN